MGLLQNFHVTFVFWLVLLALPNWVYTLNAERENLKQDSLPHKERITYSTEHSQKTYLTTNHVANFAKQGQHVFSSSLHSKRDEMLQAHQLEDMVSKLIWHAKNKKYKLFSDQLWLLKKRFPSSSEAHYFQALAYYLKKDGTKALFALDKALFLKKDFARAWNLKGVILNSLDRDEEAVVCFAKATQLNQYQPYYIYNTAFSLYRLDRWDEAMVSLKRAQKLKPNFSAAHYLSALIHYDEGRKAKAFLSFTLAHEFGEDRPQFLLDYLTTAQEMKEGRQALQLAKLLWKTKEQSITLLRTLVKTWRIFGKYRKALKASETLLQNSKANWTDKKNYVYILSKVGLDPQVYIKDMNITAKEKQALFFYAKQLRLQSERKKLLKTSDPILR